MSDIKGIKFYTSRKPKYACGLGAFSIDGIEPTDIQSKLFNTYNIYTISVKVDNIDGLRITPNVFTSAGDLDKFVNAVHQIVKAK